MVNYKDCIELTNRLAEDHQLSQLEPRIIERVRSINTYICRDQRICDLLNALYRYSPHTLEHLINTQITACFICIEGKLDELSTDYVLVSALLHDIGKLLIPHNILTKPGSLTNSEWRIMKSHPLCSVRLLLPLGLPSIILNMVKHHHICYNRTGYPDFYSSPLSWYSADAEKMIGVLAMADAFDAMYHRRSYRPPYSMDKIHLEITSCISTQFAPMPANIMLNTLSSLLIRKDVVIC